MCRQECHCSKYEYLYMYEYRYCSGVHAPGPLAVGTCPLAPGHMSIKYMYSGSQALDLDSRLLAVGGRGPQLGLLVG